MNNHYFITSGKKATILDGKLDTGKNVSMICASTNKVQIENSIAFHKRSNAHYESSIVLQVVECDSDLNVLNVSNYK